MAFVLYQFFGINNIQRQLYKIKKFHLKAYSILTNAVFVFEASEKLRIHTMEKPITY